MVAAVQTAVQCVKKLVEAQRSRRRGSAVITEVDQGPQSEGPPFAKERAEWIEIAKGIGVTFVILVHSMIPDINPGTTHLSSFTIPIFFMLTGLTYDNEKHRNHLGVLAKLRARQLLIPYFSLYLIMIVLFIPLSSYVDTYLTPDQVLFWLLYGNGPPNSASHLWFLPVLYFGLMAFALVDKITYRLSRGFKWVALIILMLAANTIWSIFRPVLIPWRFSSILIAAAFVLIGNELRQSRGLKALASQSAAKNLAGILALTVAVLTLSQLNGFTDMAVDSYGACVWLYLGAGTAGCLLVFQVSSLLHKSSAPGRGLFALGGVSQEAYEVHPVTFYLVPIVATNLGLSLTSDPTVGSLLWLVRFLLGVILSYVLASRLIRKNSILSLIFSGRSRSQDSTVPQR